MLKRRTDQLCPSCGHAPRYQNQSYCKACYNAKREVWVALRKARKGPRPSAFDENGLTKGQVEVLRLRCAGLPAKLIAHRLELELRSVKARMSGIRSVVQHRTGEQLGAWAIRKGYVALEDCERAEGFRRGMARADEVAADAERAGL
jgi:DNA-binding CsgD family transcriptional regulator